MLGSREVWRRKVDECGCPAREYYGCGFNYVSSKWPQDLPVAGQGWAGLGEDVKWSSVLCGSHMLVHESEGRKLESSWLRVGQRYKQGCPPDLQAIPQDSFSPKSGQRGLGDDTTSLLWISLHLQVCLWDLSKWALCGVFLDSVQFFFLGLLVCHFSVWCLLNLGDYVPEAQEKRSHFI